MAERTFEASVPECRIYSATVRLGLWRNRALCLCIAYIDERVGSSDTFSPREKVPRSGG